MILLGRIEKQSGPFWSAECDLIGAFTQGTSLADAIDMLRSLVELLVDSTGFKATVADLGRGEDGAHAVAISASEPTLLAVHVLKYQREVSGLSLADVAKRLGVSSRSSYASYEQGRSEPSLSKYAELLGAVAPDLALIVAERKPVKAAQPKKKRPARKRRAA